ncbi:MAG: ester cyclase [Parvularcula sp.]
MTVVDWNDRIVRFLDEIWRDEKTDLINHYIAPTYTIHHDPGDPWDGKTLDRDGYIERLLASRAGAPDQAFTTVHRAPASDGFAIFWTWTATHSGPLAGFSPTGQPLTMTGATFYYTDGAYLTGHWQIADRLGVYQQLAAAQKGT